MIVKATAYIRHHLGHYYMKPGDYQDSPISRIAVGLKRRGYTTNH
jgi:hypothetical protein